MTPTRTLELEIHVPPIDLYLDSRLAAFHDRLANSEVPIYTKGLLGNPDQNQE